MVVTRKDFHGGRNMFLPDELINFLQEMFVNDRKIGRPFLRVLDRMGEYEHTLEGLVEMDKLTELERRIGKFIEDLAVGYRIAQIINGRRRTR